MIAPDTSTTLLRDLAGRADHPRWGEFVARYRPLMESYLHERFSSLEMDDLIQETFVAIAKALPDYRYDPDEKGHFHNYLIGILRHKALNVLKRQDRHIEVVREYAADLSAREIGGDADVEKWREILFWTDRPTHRIFKRVGDSPVTRVGRVQPVAERMREKLARSRS